MKRLNENAEVTTTHCDMDDLMCKLLISLGYKDGIEIFKNFRKWYT